MVCPNCKKDQVSPEERCDCRLTWQINKSFELQEEINKLQQHITTVRKLILDQPELDTPIKLWEYWNDWFGETKKYVLKS